MTRTDRILAVVATEGGEYEPVPRLRVKARSYPKRILRSGACDNEKLLSSRLSGRYGPPILRLMDPFWYGLLRRRWIKHCVSRTYRPTAMAIADQAEARWREAAIQRRLA
jgi:hypothetical protein